ncbi:MAG: cell division ATP-binding protein FtsE [Deltaproteobacteria bacterium]|jgi:cell division transport system ATP-binding protein|nr:cell division ATP-binding protein FtsE [Deltaproteobacteria bacterium]MCW8893994.1 cell division ATP-binding protein FtsE [Deltaproteobacteria bacterium]MCW9049409.1 cell division ATP-binding protein FtsE [Deltaproteobacteria bacterium]
MIQLYNVTKKYSSDSVAVKDLTLQIGKGDFVYITGASGAGKTTFLRMLYAAEKPTRGQILINKKNITRIRGPQIPYLRRQIGVVFQDFKLLQSRTVYENVAFALEAQGKKRYEVSKKVYQALKEVGLEHRLQRRPLELSGGEQQRIAIARALVVDPLILLADEPSGNLDQDVTLEIMELFKRANARGTTVLLATHDHSLNQRFPRRVITLDQGKLVGDQQPLQV